MISAIYFFILLELIFVAIVDFKTKRISNRVIIGNILIFAIVALAQFGDYEWKMHFYFPIAMLFLGYLLYLMRIMGGGDAKLISTLLLIIPSAEQIPFLEKLCLCTVAVAGILLLMTLFKNFKLVLNYIAMRQWKLLNLFGSKFPFAPIVLMAWLWLGIEKIAI